MSLLGIFCMFSAARWPNSMCRNAYNTVVSLKDGRWEVDAIEQLPEGVQPQISVEELLLCEDIIRKDERVVKLAADVGE